MKKTGMAALILTVALALTEAFCLSRVAGDEPGFVPTTKPAKPSVPPADEFFAPAPIAGKAPARPVSSPQPEPVKPDSAKPEEPKTTPHAAQRVNPQPRESSPPKAGEQPAQAPATPGQTHPSAHYLATDVQYFPSAPTAPNRRQQSPMADWVPVDAMAVAVLKTEALVQVPEFAAAMKSAMSPKLWELMNALDRLTMIVMSSPEDLESALEVSTFVLHARTDESFAAITDFLPPDGPEKTFAGQTYNTSGGLSWFQPDARTLVFSREATLLRLILNGPNSKARMVTAPRWQQAATADLAIAINPSRLGRMFAPRYPVTAEIEEFAVPNISQAQYAQATPPSESSDPSQPSPSCPTGVCPPPSGRRVAYTSQSQFAYPELLAYVVSAQDIQFGVNLRGSHIEVLTGLETPKSDEAELNNGRIVGVAWATLEAIREEIRTKTKDVAQQAVQIALINIMDELAQSSTSQRRDLGTESTEFHWTATTEVNPHLLHAVAEMVTQVFVPQPPTPKSKPQSKSLNSAEEANEPSPEKPVPAPVSRPDESAETTERDQPIADPRSQPDEPEPTPSELDINAAPEPAGEAPKESVEEAPEAPKSPVKPAGLLGDD